MRRTILSLSALSLVFPLVASAVDLTDASDIYSDARSFSKAERAGISVLTNMDVLAGNPDGSFAPRRTLNRAEFTKIAVLMQYGLTEVEEAFDGKTCFPDVPSDAWFAKFVCFAKAQGIVSGNPDGRFWPANDVNYAEALKILSEVFGYEVQPGQGEMWFRPYLQAAENRGVALMGRDVALALKRGEMARLGAAYAAESDGELDAYRDAERGVSASSMSSVTSSSASSVSSSLRTSSASLSPVASSVSSSSAASTAFRARNRFLLLGRATSPVLDGTVMADDEDILVSISDLILRREVRSIEKMWLVDEKGIEVAEYLISTTDTEKRRWKAQASSQSYRIVKNVPTLMGVKVKLKDRSAGGSSDEVFEVERFSIDAVGAVSGQTRQIVPTNQHYPLQLTAQAELTGVKNALADAGTMQQGLRKVIGSFTFSGTILPNAQLTLSEVNVRIERSGVSLSRIRIGSAAEVEQTDCSVDGADSSLVSCSFIPDALDDVVPGRTLSIIADVSVTSGDQGTLRVTLPDAGALGTNGSVKWTDGTGRFNWIDTTSPLATGTLWTVTK